jgi:hypothetical protein
VRKKDLSNTKVQNFFSLQKYPPNQKNKSLRNGSLRNGHLQLEQLEQRQLLNGEMGSALTAITSADANPPAILGELGGSDSSAFDLGTAKAVQGVPNSDFAVSFSGGRLGSGDGEYRNMYAFAALTSEGEIASWGHYSNSGSGIPVGEGYTRIFSNEGAFAALDEAGSIASWGISSYGGIGAPVGTGYTSIFSTGRAFAALDEAGLITTWGDLNRGGSGAPTDLGYTKIFSNERAFAALSAEGSIASWGSSLHGGEGAPVGSGFTDIASTQYAFAAIGAGGTISTWGDADYGGIGAPTDAGYVKIFASQWAFSALKSDGSITSWGSNYGGGNTPAEDGYVDIVSNRYAFTAIDAAGSLRSWGNQYKGGSGEPEGAGFVQVVPSQLAFAARYADGSIATWGKDDYGGAGGPIDSGYTQLVASQRAFAALSAEGSIVVWGHSGYGGSGAPEGSGYTQIFTNGRAFAALREDGSIVAWGDSENGGSDTPEGDGFVTLAGPLQEESATEIPPENLAPSIADQYFNIEEKSAAGTIVGTLSASDPEGDSLSYSILKNIDFDDDGIAAFSLEGDQLLVNDPDDLDADTTSTLGIIVEASDGSLSDSASVIVTLNRMDSVIFRIAAGDSLAFKEALINAQSGDIIELEAGATYLGNFELPKKQGDAVIVIRTSAFALLPQGRVSPSDAPRMAKISDQDGRTVTISAEFGASNYRLEGLEIISTAPAITSLVRFGYSEGRYANVLEEFSDNITIDRCYLHGSTSQSIQRGVNANGSNITLSNSYVAGIHMVGIDTQAFLAVLGTGPYTIENNFLEAAGENVLFGGAGWGNRYPEFNPQNITIRNNLISKPNRWNAGQPECDIPPHPEYDGSNWQIKNLVEFKIGGNILVEGNIIENTWCAAQDGPAVLITPREASIDNVVFRNNVIRNARYAFQVNPADQELSNVVIENNLIYNMEWRIFEVTAPSGKQTENLIIRNNTCLFAAENTTNNGYGSTQLVVGDLDVAVTNLIYQDNLISGGFYAIHGAGQSPGLMSIEVFCDGFDVRGNAIVNPNMNYETDSIYRIGDNYDQAGDFYGDFSLQGTVDQVGFADILFDDIEDFRITDNVALQAAGTGVQLDALLSALGS